MACEIGSVLLWARTQDSSLAMAHMPLLALEGRWHKRFRRGPLSSRGAIAEKRDVFVVSRFVDVLMLVGVTS